MVEFNTAESPATTIEEALAAPQLVTVGLYIVDRSFGGFEEGGWWFDRGDLIEESEIYTELGAMPGTFGSHAEAGAFMRGLQDTIDKLNKGRPDIGNSNSRGRYESMSFEGATSPRSFPDRRPTYE